MTDIYDRATEREEQDNPLRRGFLLLWTAF